MIQIISLGLGVQSSALYLLSSLGQIPRADFAVFADPGAESKATYQFLDFLEDWRIKNNGVPIVILRSRNLYDDLMADGQCGRFTSIPSFTLNDDGSVGMLRRQCTREYKITVLDNYIRDDIYKIPKGSRRPRTALWHGITLDEAGRMAAPGEAWKLNIYPFLGKAIDNKENIQNISWGFPATRKDLYKWYALHGFPIPPKSSCVFCPYQSDQSWALKKKFAPEDFAVAVKVDEAIRNSTSRGIRNPIYLHKSCRPLAEIQFDVSRDEEWNECSGNCHV